MPFGSSLFSTYFCSVFLPWKICGAFILSYRDESTMMVIRHESLGIYIYAKPKNQMEQKYNLNLTARAEAIRCRRFEAIVNERYDFFDKEKMKGDFLAYFKKLADKKNSKWQHVYMHFRTFTQGKCTFGEINVDLCNRFREYLLTAPQGLHKNSKLHINSAANYWSTFRAYNCFKRIYCCFAIHFCRFE